MASGLADGVEHDEVVLAAGGHAVDDDIGYRHVRRGERLLGIGLVRLGGLDLLGELLGRASSAGRSSLDAAPTFLLAAFCSARRLSAADTAARRARRPQQGIDEAGILTAGAL